MTKVATRKEKVGKKKRGHRKKCTGFYEVHVSQFLTFSFRQPAEKKKNKPRKMIYVKWDGFMLGVTSVKF